MNRNNQKQLLVSVVLTTSLLLFVFMYSVAADNHTTPTPISTKLPLPRPPEDLEQLQTLMTSIESCQLPCFLGFDPSHTTAKEVIAFIRPNEDFTKVKKYYIRYQFPTGDPQEAKIVISFSIENELLSALEVILFDPSDWLPENTFQLPYFLQYMSETPDAYLSISNGQGRIFLAFAYIDTGVVIQYPIILKVRGDVISPTVDEPYLLCPQLKLNGAIHLWLQMDDGQDLVDRTINPELAPNHRWSVKQMTGLSTGAFIEQIINHPDKCIDMLSYPELVKQGYEF